MYMLCYKDILNYTYCEQAHKMYTLNFLHKNTSTFVQRKTNMYDYVNLQ